MLKIRAVSNWPPDRVEAWFGRNTMTAAYRSWYERAKEEVAQWHESALQNLWPPSAKAPPPKAARYITLAEDAARHRDQGA